MIRSGAVQFHDALAPLMRPITDATPHPENNNEGDLDMLDHLVESHGMYRPVIVQASTGYIVAGNTTWETVRNRGSEVCPMVMLDVDDTTAVGILLDDNHSARLARTNIAQTLELVKRLEDQGVLDQTSYTHHDVAVLEQLADLPLEFEHASWPTLTLQVHPRTLKAFYHVTREADTDRDRLEVLLRLAGWDGS
jgi:hypothetical protein